MEYIHDYVTNIIFDENNKLNNWGNIVCFADYDGIISQKMLIKYLNDLLENNEILHQNIVKKNQKNFLEYRKIDIKEYYIAKKCNFKLFHNKTYYVLNKNYNTNWFFHLYTDTINNKSRMYFTINHAYADGYKIISLLTSGKNFQYKTPNFNRKNKNYYYILIGTCILIYLYLKTLSKVYYKENNCNTMSNKTDFISVIIKFNNLKIISIKNQLTLNDLLYSLAIKTHYHYFKKEKNILIASPFNTGNKNKTNNFFFLFTEIYNNLTTIELFQKVHNLFNYYKFSAFVLILGYIYNILGNVICRQLYKKITDNLDILYTNIIGPDKSILHDKYNNCLLFDKKNITINNIQFLMNHKKNELGFNIVSYSDNINIMVSFSKNSYNKKKLLKAINDAYRDIIK